MKKEPGQKATKQKHYATVKLAQVLVRIRFNQAMKRDTHYTISFRGPC